MRARRASLALVGALVVLPGCGGTPERPPGAEEETQVADTSIIAAQEALTSEVMGLPGVVGTAVGLCGATPCIKVYVSSPAPEPLPGIPETYRGFVVDVEVMGAFRPRGDTVP